MAGLGLGSMSSMGIGLAVYMDDQFSNASRNVSTQLQALNKDVDDFANSMARIESFGAGIAAVGDAITGMMVDSSVEFARFDDVMNSVRSIAQMGDDPAGMKMLTDQAHALGNAYGVLPQAVAAAELELAKGGKSAAEIKQMAEAVLVLGSAAEMKVDGRNGAAEILMNTMTSFGAGTEEAMKYTDALTSAANRSTIDVSDFFQSLRYSAAEAHQLGISVTELGAGIATLGNAGLKGSSAGTAYANMLRYMSKAASPFAGEKQTQALDLLGLKPEDFITAEGNLVSLNDMLYKLKTASEGMGQNDKLNIFGQIFGVRGVRAFEPLLNGVVKDANGKVTSAFSKMQANIDADVARGIGKITAVEKLDDQMGDWDKFMSQLSSFKIAIGDSLSVIVRPLIQGLTWLMTGITSFLNGPVGQWLSRSVAVFGLFMSVVGRMVVFGARFMMYIMTSAGQLRTSFQMGQMSSVVIRNNIMMAARALQASATSSMLAMRGLSSVNMGRAGMMLRNTTTGRLVGRSTGATRTLAMLFGGRTAIAMAGWFTKMGATLGPVVGWLSKTGVFLRGFGTILGRVFGVLFGWWGLAADLLSTWITGKGLLEWIWIGLKKIGEWLGWVTPDAPEAKTVERYDAKRDYEAENNWRMGERQTNQTWEQKQLEKIGGGNQTINITVNPTTGDEKTRRAINVKDQQALQSYAIN
jgi:TP901 family phage tail tape measure protein